MLIFLIILMLLCLYKIQFRKLDDDYMGIVQTTDIKGIFCVIIMLSHSKSYIEFSGGVYNWFFRLLGQLMVTMFLFYSGYGVLESYKKKIGYAEGFLKNRVFKTLLHFDIAVACYLLEGVILGQFYPLKNYILCWIGWESIGNSNWFIFDILALYTLTGLAFGIVRRGYLKKEPMVGVCILVSVFSFGMCVVLYMVGKETYWYNTVLCYPLGMWFLYIRERIDLWCKNRKQYFCTAFGMLVLFIFLYMSRNTPMYMICALVFTLLCTFFTMKIKVGNRILHWLGVHSFAIYILQRIPMIALTVQGLNENGILFTILSIAITLVIAAGFDIFIKKMDQKLFLKKH